MTNDFAEMVPASGSVPTGCGVAVLSSWMAPARSQTTRATNCANPGYSVFLHDTMRRRKKQVFRVCGRRCGQTRFCGRFSAGGFPPQATVPRTSGPSLLGKWVGRLSSKKTVCQITCYRYKSKYNIFIGALQAKKRRRGTDGTDAVLGAWINALQRCRKGWSDRRSN